MRSRRDELTGALSAAELPVDTVAEASEQSKTTTGVNRLTVLSFRCTEYVFLVGVREAMPRRSVGYGAAVRYLNDTIFVWIAKPDFGYAHAAESNTGNLFAERSVMTARPLSLAAALAALLIPISAAADITADREMLDWGFNLRLRQAYIQNGFDLSSESADDWNYLRVRSQLWGAFMPAENWKLHAMLNNEHRHWFKSNRGYEDGDFEIDEVIFESLYLQGKHVDGTPFGFTVGRQNLFYGEGFVCWDGGPLDGSRTAYFNAAVVHIEWGKRRFDVHAISDPQKDDYLPVINSQDRSMIEWDEQGAGFYYTDESYGKRKLEAYYFYKNEKDPDGVFPESDIHTLGVRVSGSAIGDLTFAAEGAGQIGDRDIAHRLAWGGYLYGTYRTPLARPLEISAGGIYLSGDDPSTDDFEGWDPVYSRWPKWSELYIYTLANERGVAYWENLASGWLGLNLKAHERVSLDAKVYAMWAPEQPFAGTGIFGGGDYRGTLSIVKIDWNCKKYLTGHLLWEMLRPGDYYADGSDAAHFLRWEVIFRY